MAKNRLHRLLAKSTTLDVPTVSAASRAESEARERRYRAEDALRTLTRAKEIERDRALMRDVKTVAREQLKTLQNVTGSPSGRR